MVHAQGANMHINLRCPDALHTQIIARGEKSDAIRTGLERHYYILAQARATLRATFTVAELGALADINNGTLWEPHTLGLLYANAEDAEDSYYSKWGVCRKELASKLRSLTLPECAALVDAMERFWAAAGTGIPVNPADLLS